MWIGLGIARVRLLGSFSQEVDPGIETSPKVYSYDTFTVYEWLKVFSSVLNICMLFDLEI